MGDILNIMKIYFSGIGGVGIGPLAEIAHDAGYQIVGSDRSASLMTNQLQKRGVQVYLSQDGEALRREHERQPIDWFIYTAALPESHPELQAAKELGIKTSKRDELIAKIIEEKQLKLIAVSGTHGKTTTTGMLIWAMDQLNIPASYSVGATLNFGPSGKFDSSSEYFIYECDEFDRNHLHFNPWLSIITALNYDHPDTYPTEDDYRQAFIQFMEQSEYSIIWQKDLRYLKHPDMPASYEAIDELKDLSDIKLPGLHMRQNAFLVIQALNRLTPSTSYAELVAVINSFPSTSRRFEKLADNLYTDYGHHPDEIPATLQLAKELSTDVVLVYQPHQNTRQHHIQKDYVDEVFANADEIYWLPTYLSREDPNLPVLTPDELTNNLSRKDTLHHANLDDELWQAITKHRQAGQLVVLMGAGSIDGWAREQILNG